MKLAATIVAALTLAMPASSQTVVDGDTIRMGAATFRLWAIDAPEAKQTCADGWQAGAAATRALQWKAGGSNVNRATATATAAPSPFAARMGGT